MNMDKYDYSYAELERMAPGQRRAIGYAIHGLLVDGSHHKTWVLERVLESLGVDLAQLRESLNADDYDWDDGIAP
jgi:hypothetical protein